MMCNAKAAVKRAGTILCMMAVLALAGQAIAATDSASFPLNVNTAGVEQLMEIPGIGSAKANAIVEYRQQKPFESVEELKNVKGIGDKVLAKITPYVTVGGGARGAKAGTAGN